MDYCTVVLAADRRPFAGRVVEEKSAREEEGEAQVVVEERRWEVVGKEMWQGVAAQPRSAGAVHLVLRGYHALQPTGYIS